MRRPVRDCAVAIVLSLTALTATAEETLELQGATIVGNRELPKALHIVPWKATTPGELAGRPLQSLVNEVLAPVDREVLLRELHYYDAVHGFE